MMGDINVKHIRKAAEILGMKPEVLIDKLNDNKYKDTYQKIIEKVIKSDFEEKANRLTRSKFNIFSSGFKISTIKKQENQGFVVLVILLLLIVIFSGFIMSGFTESFITNKIKQSVSETEQYVLIFRLVIVTFILTTLMLSILIFAGMFCKIIYNWITETKSPQRYAVEEMVKIIELIEKSEKY